MAGACHQEMQRDALSKKQAGIPRPMKRASSMHAAIGMRSGRGGAHARRAVAVGALGRLHQDQRKLIVVEEIGACLRANEARSRASCRASLARGIIATGKLLK